MDRNIAILPIREADYRDVSIMVGELLEEIMSTINSRVFQYDQKQTEETVKDLISRNRYWIFVAKEFTSRANIGFASLYESYALYAEGAFATMPELYIRPQWRSNGVGRMLLHHVCCFAGEKGWRRIEVTTPPLPEFERTLSFYLDNGFEISGGRKLKKHIDR